MLNCGDRRLYKPTYPLKTPDKELKILAGLAGVVCDVGRADNFAGAALSVELEWRWWGVKLSRTGQNWDWSEQVRAVTRVAGLILPGSQDGRTL